MALYIPESWKVAGRHLHYDAGESVSGGVSDGGAAREQESFLHLRDRKSPEEYCQLTRQGYLPCATNAPGHFLLIVVYEYLLYLGESLVGGDGEIVRIFGKKIYIAMISQLLDSSPEFMILFAIALSSSKEKAQEYAITGVGLLVGSTIFLLTLLWGVCFICGMRKFYLKPGFEVKNKVLQLILGYGVITDADNTYHAKVVLFSLIPFVVILLWSVFSLWCSIQEDKIVLVASLSVSFICLVAYFCHQWFDGRIRERRFNYAEIEHKIEMKVPFYEVQTLMLDREKHLLVKQKEMEIWLKSPEPDVDKITFFNKFEEWLDETRQLMDDPYSLDKLAEYNYVSELLVEERDKFIELVSLMMNHASGEDLLAKDGPHDESSIDRFFEHIDDNDDKSITRSELKNYIMEMNHNNILIDDDIADIFMRHLDIDGSGDINQQEFKWGVSEWIVHIKRLTSYKEKKQLHFNSRERDGFKQGAEKARAFETLKVSTLLILGICMLFFFGEPLVENVQQLSEFINIDPFYVSFILVPLATNARTAITAIRAAFQRRHHTTSLAFSEIYHKVFMNNILAFSVLVSIIYFRGLTWHFSAEILVMVIVCLIMGVLTSFRSKFPIWIFLIAFLLYPVSLIMVYLIAD